MTSTSALAAATFPTPTLQSDYYGTINTPTTTRTARTMTIRHAGRAHIRGKIRRIWRPRYLELCDSGLVRYFELPSSTTTANTISANAAAAVNANVDVNVDPDLAQLQSPLSSVMITTTGGDVTAAAASAADDDDDERAQDLAHFNMILKDTLVIYHARIIDVTTLRDIHVGLPKGCYGFLFRGQRLYVNVDLLSSPSSQNDSQTPQRDYFCAVSTLEEAQAWVVALQWAAEMRQSHRFYHHRSLSAGSSSLSISASSAAGETTTSSRRRQYSFDGYSNNSNSNSNNNNNNKLALVGVTDDDDDFVMTYGNNSTAASNVRPGIVGLSNCGMATSSSYVSARKSGHGPPPSSSYRNTATSSRSSSKASRILVTKTYGYQIVKIKSSSSSSSQQQRWDIAYQVALLVITVRQQQTQQSQTTSGSASPSASASTRQSTPANSSSSRRQVSVEERRVLLTAQDVQDLIREISQNAVKSRILQPFVQQLKQQADTLPKWDGNSEKQSDLRCCVYKIKPTGRSEEEGVHKVAVDAVGKIDGILRALSMESSAVNSSSMKKAFGLDMDRPDVLNVDEGGSSAVESNAKNTVTKTPWMRLLNAAIGGTSSVDYLTLVQKQANNTRDSSTATPTTIYRQVRHLPDDVIVDVFVREWLSKIHNRALRKMKLDQRRRQKEAQQWQHSVQLWIEERPWLVAGGLGVAAASLYPASQLYSKLSLSTNVRADVLAASWCIAFWLGKKHQENKHQRIKKTAQAAKSAKQQNLHCSRQVDTANAISPSSRSQPLSPSQQTIDSYDMVLSQQSSLVSAAPNKPGFVLAANSISLTGSVDDETQDGQASDDSASDGDGMDYLESDNVEDEVVDNTGKLSSPLPKYPDNDGSTCWSENPSPAIFRVRGSSYFEDRVKIPSGQSPFKCRGVDIWMTDNPERHIARHPSVLGGKLKDEDTFLVNFLLPFGNFVAYFSVPPLEEFPNPQVASVWSKFIQGDQQYRDARLKLLPVVMEGPWIVKAAVGNGTAPALLGKVIPLQYFFDHPTSSGPSSDCVLQGQDRRKGIYEVDVIITASSIAKGILSVVKSHTKSLTIAFALIIEAAKQEELPETVLCHFQIHSVDLADCPILPPCNLEDVQVGKV